MDVIVEKIMGFRSSSGYRDLYLSNSKGIAFMQEKGLFITTDKGKAFHEVAKKT